MSTERKRPTIKDVAAAAGVGAMTVSYSFNQPSRVAAETRNRVFEAADRLGYRQDATARALRSGRTGQLGVVIGEHLSYAFDDPQAAQFLAGIADVCVETDTGMVLIPTHGESARSNADDRGVVSDVDRVLSTPVDGYVLWTTTTDDPVLDAVAASGRPAAIQGGPEHAGISRVGPDDRAAAAAVASAAFAAADSKPTPIVVSFPLDHGRESGVHTGADLPTDLDEVTFPVTARRLAGYRDALAAAGFAWDETLIAVAGRNQRRDGRDLIQTVLAQLPDNRHVVVLAMSDELALGASAALQTAGCSARVTGWDATSEGRDAGIISVTNSLRDQGRACARLALGSRSDDGGAVRWEITIPK